MDRPIRVAVIGYGNLGKGAIKAISHQADMTLAGIFTRRDPVSLKTDAPAYRLDNLAEFRDRIDVCLLCGGSATDLDRQGPEAVKLFNTVDTFDTHAKIPDYFSAMDKAAKASGRTAIISAGWDPGLFSLLRVYEEAVLPAGESITFWGKGVSQGHSEAIRRIEGVKDAVQYTIPVEEMRRQFLEGKHISSAPGNLHRRECFVVLEEGADEAAIREQIVTMPHYFAAYETDVHFISEKELKEKHTGMPHGGSVLRRGSTSEGVLQTISFYLQLDSNPEFTASVLVATARAAQRMSDAGQSGAFTLFDVPPALFSLHSAEELRRNYL